VQPTRLSSLVRKLKNKVVARRENTLHPDVHAQLWSEPEAETMQKSDKLPHYQKFMGTHPKAQETASWVDDNISHRGLAEFGMRQAKTRPEGLGNEEKSQLKHFNDSLHMPEVKKGAGELTKDHTWESGIEKLNAHEAAYTEKHKKIAPSLVPSEGEKLLDLGEGVGLYNLPLDGARKNKHEAVGMGHCATALEGGDLWSIRKDHGNGMVEPMVTLSHADGYVGEVKGKHNWKPSEKHHSAILKVLASDLVKGFVGGGYAPESNFSLNDVKPEWKQKLTSVKPTLMQKPYIETLPLPFADGYNHEPDVPTIAKIKDPAKMLRLAQASEPKSAVHNYSAKNPNISPEVAQHLAQTNNPGSRVHENLAKNPNLSPEVAHHLVQTNKPRSGVHVLLAENPNLSPEAVKHLAQTNEPDSPVHGILAENPNLSPELAQHLAQTNEPDYPIHNSLAKNPNLSPEVAHHLAQTNKPDSDVHKYLAKNPNLPPEVAQHLAQTNKPGAFVHVLLAKNPNLSPELAHHLAQTDKPGAFVHNSLAQNPNLSPELAHHLAQTNKPDSSVHLALAKNPNLSPELAHHLAQASGPASGVHLALAKNPNLSPELAHHLAQANEPVSSVHLLLAKNPNLSPEAAQHLAQTNKPDSSIHAYLAENPNLSPEAAQHLAQTNKPDSDVHNSLAQNPKYAHLALSAPRPQQATHIQKLIGILNDENADRGLQRQAAQEIKTRREEELQHRLSDKGDMQDLLNLAESSDDDVSEKATKEIQRRNLQKSMRKSESKAKTSVVAKLKAKITTKPKDAPVPPHEVIDSGILTPFHQTLIMHGSKVSLKEARVGHSEVNPSSNKERAVNKDLKKGDIVGGNPEAKEKLALTNENRVSSSPAAIGAYKKPFQFTQRDGASGRRVNVQTSSGKNIMSHFDHAAHQDFSSADHKEAAVAHQRHLIELKEGRPHPDLLKFHQDQYKNHWQQHQDLKNRSNTMLGKSLKAKFLKKASLDKSQTLSHSSAPKLSKSSTLGQRIKAALASPEMPTFPRNHHSEVPHHDPRDVKYFDIEE